MRDWGLSVTRNVDSAEDWMRILCTAHKQPELLVSI